MFYSEGQATLQQASQTGIPRGTLEIVIQEVLWSIRGSYSAIWSIHLMNVKWHSDPWPTVISQAIRLSTNFMTMIPSLTFTDYDWFPWSIYHGCGMPAGNAYSSGHLVPSPIVGLACAPIVETRFLELAMSLLDFSPRKPLGTFSILLCITLFKQVPCIICGHRRVSVIDIGWFVLLLFQLRPMFYTLLLLLRPRQEKLPLTTHRTQSILFITSSNMYKRYHAIFMEVVKQYLVSY